MITRTRTANDIRLRFYCDKCGWRISTREYPLDDGESDPSNAEQHLCSECHDRIWSGLRKDCCPQCHTRPCERGGECWINPWPNIMYLCHVGERIGPYHPGLIRGLRLMDQYLEGVVSCDKVEAV